MAPVSNPASLSSVVSVFGGPGNLTAYYRGGPYVPDTPTNAAISTTSNGLALSQFAGASAYIPVSASVSPTSISKTGSGTNPSGPSGTSSPVTATGSGGNGSYTYSWTRASGDANTIISSTTASVVTFSRGNCADGTIYTSVWRCTISDGTSSDYADVTVNLAYVRNI